IKPGAIADIDVLVELSTAKTPPRMPGLAELLRPSICGENTQATARLATQSIQLWGSPASYPPLLELTKNAKGNERLKGRAPLTALRDGLPMAPEILPVDRELLQISLVWLDGKPFPGLNEHLKALADAKPQRTSNELTVLLIPYLDPQFEKKTNVAALGGLLKWGTGTAIAPISKRFENETTPEIKKAATAITEALKKRVEAIKNSKKPKPDSTK
ncbi:MAG: hypothetical protein JWM11_2808, partial [Planctomycetaceae bacterium]|nr:hypothetical protein [Planctomycetaceae bacterium]